MKKPRSAPDNALIPVNSAPFSAGALVLVTLGNPRDKFWGMILKLAPEGLSVSGIELASFDDVAALVKDREPFTPAVVFFPMHRVERLELDLADGNLPSLSERFQTTTALSAAAILGSWGGDETGEHANHPSASRSHSERGTE